MFHGQTSQERVLLGSSNGAIEVEAVNLDKIRGKLSDLRKLREASLDGESVSSSEPSDMIQECCPSESWLLILYRFRVLTWEQIYEVSTCP
jgi:tubulin-specific chaperone E